MKKKQTLALLLAGAMLVPNAFAASPEDFHDFPTDWSAAGLRSAVQNGLLNGSNGEIDGNGLLTRAQLAAIVGRAFGADKAADLSGFTDVRPDAWYHNDMAVSVAMGAFQGANGKLNPSLPSPVRKPLPYWRAPSVWTATLPLCRTTPTAAAFPVGKERGLRTDRQRLRQRRERQTQSPEQHHPCGIRQGHHRHGEHVRG